MSNAAAMMGCGHVANAMDGDGKPVCVICVGIDPRATIEVTEDQFSALLGRRARCDYYGQASTRSYSCNHAAETGCSRDACTCELASTRGLTGELAFFDHRPDDEFDRFYCGCKGWE